MSTVRRAALLLPLVVAAACEVTPRPGTQIGALREPDPDPAPPTDYKSLDMTAAVEDALRVGGLTTLASAWAGHTGTLDVSRRDCPEVWIGALPEDLVDADLGGDDDNPGLSWLSSCETDPGKVAFEGFTHWSTSIVEDTSGTRSLVADATITDGNDLLFSFDGEATDSLDLPTSTYSSTLNGELSGSLVGVGTGLRTGGDFEATWSSAGTIRMFGTVTMFDGFGPPDTRSPDTSPELANLPGWEPRMPRFTSVRFDLEFTADCTAEPVGFVGIRGNEGFWFDAYFLPIYDPEEGTAQSRAFPYEQIDNIACDGIGTLFARNIDLKTEDETDASWSRDISPDFGAIIGSLVMPTLDQYVYTLRNVPEE
ncbi:MAG: hypothetical protein ABMB14_24960 [Myxococcota bacterium]